MLGGGRRAPGDAGQAGSGGIDIFGALPQLALRYSHDPALTNAAYLAERLVADGLLAAAVFAYRWWVLLVSWTALRSQAWPAPVCCVRELARPP